MITNGCTVAIEYTLTLETGEIISTATEDRPLVYEHGRGEILPALEQVLNGLDVDDRKEVHLLPEQAFGTEDPSLIESVAIDSIPEHARRPGVQLEVTNEAGKRSIIRVVEVHRNHILLNLNHPLAGEAVRFDVHVLGVDAPLRLHASDDFTTSEKHTSRRQSSID